MTEYNPQLISGKIYNKRDCSEADLQTYKLDEGRCYQFDLSKEITVIMVGRINLTFENDMNVSLYLPKEMVDAIWRKHNPTAYQSTVLPPGLLQIE